MWREETARGERHGSMRRVKSRVGGGGVEEGRQGEGERKEEKGMWTRTGEREEEKKTTTEIREERQRGENRGEK